MSSPARRATQRPQSRPDVPTGWAATANAGMAFTLEVVLLVAIGHAGFVPGGSFWAGVAIAVGSLALVAVLWGLLAAPTAQRRLPMPWLLLFKIAAFGTGALALAWSGQPQWAIVFAGVSAIHLTLATVIGQV